MTERPPEPNTQLLDQEPREPAEEAYGNNFLGLALFGAFLVLFAGTFLVGLAYLALD